MELNARSYFSFVVVVGRFLWFSANKKCSQLCEKNGQPQNEIWQGQYMNIEHTQNHDFSFPLSHFSSMFFKKVFGFYCFFLQHPEVHPTPYMDSIACVYTVYCIMSIESLPSFFSLHRWHITGFCLAFCYRRFFFTNPLWVFSSFNKFGFFCSMQVNEVCVCV